MHMGNINQLINQFIDRENAERSRGLPTWPHKFWYALKYISKTSKAINFKFGAQIYVSNFSKNNK